jgi:subtilisin family serine protease
MRRENVKRGFLLTVAASVVALTALPAAAKDYVLSAQGALSQAHFDAITRAGGAVSYSHESGFIAASSDGAEFLAAVLASGAFDANASGEDMTIQWIPDLRTFEAGEAAITPGNETFWNLQWAPKAISAPAAWAAGCTGKGVRVAVLDTGIHSAHVDLAPNFDAAASRSFVPGFNYNQDTGTFWHGTHVAGIVASADNGIGTIGIAPEATIVGVKVLHGGSGAFSWVISGILYAATPLSQGGGGADIINMSLGAEFPKNLPGAGPLVAALNKAVNYADRHGVLVVSAAGNSARDLDHSGNLVATPAESGSGIAIAATGPVGFAVGYPNGATNFSRPASYTNYGNSAIHVSAPGGDFVLPGSALCTIPRIPSGSVTVPCWVFDLVISPIRGSGASISTYAWAAGTSMATPAAAGVAALIKQANPGISLGALKTALARSSDDVGKPGHDPFSGHGFVNAAAACAAASN